MKWEQRGRCSISAAMLKAQRGLWPQPNYRMTRKGQEIMTTALKFRSSAVAVLAA
jgi:hypothetical protein